MIEIFLPKTEYEVKSGKKVAIIAILRGWTGKKPPKLIWLVSDGEGEITDKGQFLAPTTKEDKEAKVTVLSVDSTIVPKEVVVRIKKADVIKIHQRNVKMLSGGELSFSYKSDFPVTPRWEIVDYSWNKGTIDASGLYKSPAVIKNPTTVKIRVLDLNSGVSDEVDVELLPVELRVGPQPKVYAGQEKVRLNIESHNDLQGLDNFTCRITSRPMLGKVENGGVYYPSLRIDEIREVEVEATSCLDSAKKAKLKFELGFPLCKFCKAETDVKGICPACGKAVSYGAYLKK